ncbi:hypothetical protein ACP4OV_001161 [Aristida adscensionis]
MSIAMAILVLALAVLVPLPATFMVTESRSNCSTRCGDTEISKPFGIGPKCSLPGFNLTCVVGAGNTSSLLLGTQNITVVYGTGPLSVIDYPFPTIRATLAYSVMMIPGVRDYSIHWEAPGRPFVISGSSGMSLFIVGCGIKASLFTGDSGVEVGNCSVVCVADQIMERLLHEECLGFGCCRIDITVHLRAFTLNISRTDQSVRLLKQVKALISKDYLFQVSDLKSSLTAVALGNQAVMSWAIPYQPNCKHAMKDKASYACISEHSKCEEAPIGGYVCSCSDGFSGNPYIVKGCVREANCSTRCDIDEYGISYPFGIGPDCSLSGFNLTCARLTDSTSLLLGNLAIMNISSIYSNSKSHFPTIFTTIGYFVQMIPGVRNYSMRWEAPGRPFFISNSSGMSLFIVGCGIRASLFIGDSSVEVGNCSVVCTEDQIMESMESLPFHEPCVGLLCCRIDITVDLRAFTLNMSRIDQSTQLMKKVNAFFTYGDEDGGYGDGGYGDYSDIFHSYPTNSDDLITNGYVTELSWAIPYKPNCKRAMEDIASYASVSNHSECKEAPIDGYFCICSKGSFGNPYIANGCTEEAETPTPPADQNVYDAIQPRENCPIWCGNVSVPFPFGTEVGCFAKLELYLACNPGLSPPVLQMSDGRVVTDISIDQGILRVSESLGEPPSPLYALSGERSVLKWAIDTMACKNATATLGYRYRCVSHTDCVDVTDDTTLKQVGYRCKCSLGFQGNPYISCKDIDECLQPDRYICKGICHNTFGSYTCTSCPHGTDFSDNKCKPTTVILGVTIGLSSGGGILFIAAVVALLTRRWKRSVQKRLRKRYFLKNKGVLLEQLISSDQTTSDGTKIFSLDELEKATNNFDHDRVVGRGGHGTVYKGILTDQRVVAIKRSKLDSSTEIEQFINEVSILSQINHRNVVKLHGCCLEAKVPLLVYEFVSNGTLYELLHSEQDGALQSLSWEERLRIAVEVAGALTYLHSAASVSILHRDVKCMNVLLNDSYTAKVSDFGASRSIPIDQTHLVTAVQGTFGYLDPEYYHTGQLNEKSDVYSFGVILLELLTRKKPIFESENGEKQNLSNYFLWAMGEKPLGEVVDGEIVGEASEEAMATMAGLAAECLRLTRGERPSMKDVEMRLQMLRARHAAAPGPRSCEAATTTVVSRRRGGGVVPVPLPAAAGGGHHGSRQYSLEQEFVSSSRVPR